MPKREEFIAIFKAEAEEYVTKLDHGLVELEKDPAKLELIKELNLVVHTLKGSARVFGFNQIQEISHLIENIFEEIYQKKLEFNSSIAQKIFKGLDSIRSVLARTLTDEGAQIDTSGVCDALREFITPDVKAAPRQEKQASQKTADNAKSASGTDEYIRVPLSRVNKILNLSGEIVINKMKTSAKISHAKALTSLAKKSQKILTSLAEALKSEISSKNAQAVKLLAELSADIQKIKDGSTSLWENISTEAFHLDPVIDNLQASMKEMRMLPLSTIFEGFPRMVRDIAAEKGKAINLEISGQQTELDKKVLEGIKDPLIHILRNCVDHGIEEPDKRIKSGKAQSGTIKLSAYHKAGNVVICVEDDGRGLDETEIKRIAIKKNLVPETELERMTDKEILNIVFMNGYSTSPIITDISGRGIGLDIVRRNIENLKGEIILKTEKNKGTSFSMVLPLTIAIMRVLLLKTNNMLFAFPLSLITENLKIKKSDVSTIESRMAITIRGHTIALVKLDEVLGFMPALVNIQDGPAHNNEELSVIIASSFGKKVGFIVDEIVGDEEVFIKSLGQHLGKIKNVSGATILWTGEVAIILDVEDLMINSRLGHPVVMDSRANFSKGKKEKRILLVEDAISTRELEKNILESEGYLVDVAVDGLDGLEKATKARYDIIISDIQMPRMDGLTLCENLKQNDVYREIPVILVTALSREEDKRRGIQAGASAYIIKTAFDQSVLIDTIHRLID